MVFVSLFLRHNHLLFAPLLLTHCQREPLLWHQHASLDGANASFAVSVSLYLYLDAIKGRPSPDLYLPLLLCYPCTAFGDAIIIVTLLHSIHCYLNHQGFRFYVLCSFDVLVFGASIDIIACCFWYMGAPQIWTLFFQHDCSRRFWCICCFRSSVLSDLTSRASLSLSLFLFSGASNRDPCCFWCIAQSHPACKQWDKKIQCLRFCPCVQPPGLQKSFENIRLNLCP